MIKASAERWQEIEYATPVSRRLKKKTHQRHTDRQTLCRGNLRREKEKTRTQGHVVGKSRKEGKGENEIKKWKKSRGKEENKTGGNRKVGKVIKWKWGEDSGIVSGQKYRKEEDREKKERKGRNEKMRLKDRVLKKKHRYIVKLHSLTACLQPTTPQKQSYVWPIIWHYYRTLQFHSALQVFIVSLSSLFWFMTHTFTVLV